MNIKFIVLDGLDPYNPTPVTNVDGDLDIFDTYSEASEILQDVNNGIVVPLIGIADLIDLSVREFLDEHRRILDSGNMQTAVKVGEFMKEKLGINK